MAVKKADLEGYLDQKYQKELEDAEAKIDEVLKRDYVGTTLSISLNVSPLVQRKLRNRYERAGWTISFQHDQRDGDWVELS